MIFDFIKNGAHFCDFERTESGYLCGVQGLSLEKGENSQSYTDDTYLYQI